MMSYSPNRVHPDSTYQALPRDAERVFSRGWLQPAMSVALRYGLALILVSVALLLAQMFLYYGLPQPFTAFALSAIASTFRYGGTKPGILSALISWLVRDHFFEPEVSGESRILYGLVFLVFALVMILVMRGQNELEARVAERTAELRQTNEDLTDREGRVRRLVDSNIIGIFIWELDGRIIKANDAFLHMVGYDSEDLARGRVRWTNLTPAEWRERDERALAELNSTGTVRPYEKEYFRKDGSRVPVLIGGAPFEEGGNEGVAFVLNLTERNRVGEALRESEAKFRDYAETASDWFWEIGSDYKFTLLTVNAFGSDPAGRIGTACWDHALDLETEPEKWRLLWATLESRKPFRDFVYCCVGVNSAPMCVKACGKPVFDTNGEFRGYRGTGTDVTAIMRVQQAEASLQAVQAELAHVSRVTTLGQLTASIAHEIAQPIATARNNARAALNFLDRQPPELGEVREALACVVGDADRAGDIIDRIRDHIRKAPPRKHRFDLNEAINEVIALARSAITENGVSVQTRLAEGLFPVQGDRVQLQQVALNLILNAIEAMSSVEAGPRELLISTEQTQENGVLVTVRDSGLGIDPEHVERVFEAFYTTKTSGVGMGLSICRSIIGAHGGRLWADTNEPRGAVFRFALPARRGNSAPNYESIEIQRKEGYQRTAERGRSPKGQEVLCS
jgi:PAS domain S-box-containing protein